MCYKVKWNAAPTYQEERPIFPVSVFPKGSPVLDVTQTNPADVDECKHIPSALNPGSKLANFWWWDMDQYYNDDFLPPPTTSVAMPAANAFYAYSYPYAWSANTGRERSNTITMFFLMDTKATMFHFYILDKAWDGSGGSYNMTLSGTDPFFARGNIAVGAGGTNPDPSPSNNIVFHDEQKGNKYPDAVDYTPGTPFTPGTVPIMLRDDPWNKYEYDASTGRYKFHWLWHECCTDGMIVGPMPPAGHEAYNVTYEADCSTMTGLERGTRISMWSPLGAPYTDAGNSQTDDEAACSADVSQWLHYDVPMEQTCTWTHGVQVEGRPCSHHCADYHDCGSCSSQLQCGWDSSVAGGACVPMPMAAPGSVTSLTHMLHPTPADRTCPVCAAMTTPYDCMCEEGCGWAPLEGKCISGTPDHPSDQTVTVVQWTTKGCPNKGCPRDIDDNPLGKWQCYRGAYNEKKAFANVELKDEYPITPATSFPAGHPKVGLDGLDTDKYPAEYLEGTETWFKTGALFDAATGEPEPSPDWAKSTDRYSGVAFFAYGYPEYASSNTGSESCGSMVTFMVQDDTCNSYVLVLIDKAGCGKGGYIKMDIATTGLVSADPAYTDPIAFQNDPQAIANVSLDSYTWNPATQSGTAEMTWDACCNDGLVVGPLPYSRAWSVNFKTQAHGSSGRTLDTFKIGTYDARRNEVGFIESNIKKVTTHWGGLQYDAMECTDWCQRYTDCDACTRDEQCTFSAAHGGCVAADAYIYDYGCVPDGVDLPAPITKVMAREAEAWVREAKWDGFESGATIRYAYDARLDMSCPCNTRYRYFLAVYDAATMQPIYTDSAPIRLNAEHTFVDLPHDQLTDGKEYKFHSHLCVDQGTLSRDHCSQVTIDTFTYQHNPPPPPPSPPSSPPPPPEAP